jgi:copper chaperone CopZ
MFWKENHMKTSFKATDIGCDHCALKIKKELAKLKAVTNVQVDVATKMVTFEYDSQQTLAQAKAQLAEIGYPLSE